MKTIFLTGLILNVIFYEVLNEEQKNSWLGLILLITTLIFGIILTVITFGV